jgi:hypothetical protein
VLRTSWRLTSVAATVALLLTALVLAVPALRLSYRAPALHVALETAEAIIALVVAYLVGGRFRDHRRMQELLLLCGLVVLAGTNLLLSAIPSAVLLSQDQELSRWAPLVARLLGTLLVTAAALVPSTATVAPGRARSVVLGVVAAVLLLVLLALTLGDRLPPVVDPSVDLTDSTRPLLAGHPLALVAQAVSGLLYAAAAVAFTAQATRAPTSCCAGSGPAARWLPSPGWTTCCSPRCTRSSSTSVTRSGSASTSACWSEPPARSGRTGPARRCWRTAGGWPGTCTTD